MKRVIDTKLNNNEIIISLEKGTCTDRAVEHFLKINNISNSKIIYENTFDECLEKAKQNVGSIIILPYIHSLCQKLEYNSEWVSLKKDIFLFQNPPLYLVKGNHSLGSECACLPTLAGLVEHKNLNLIDANNTQDAARQAFEGKTSYAVTNENGQQKYNLHIVEKLKEINMIWIPFRYIGN